MKRRRKRPKSMRVMHLWSFSEVTKAVPYLRSITSSLREHWLDVLTTQRQLDRATQTKSPAKREQILEEETRKDERQRAQNKFEEALEELNRIDVFLLDPVRGTALLPFRKEDDLAWYVFDLFTSAGLVGWRLHNDPIDECRPLQVLQDAEAKNAVTS